MSIRILHLAPASRIQILTVNPEDEQAMASLIGGGYMEAMTLTDDGIAFIWAGISSARARHALLAVPPVASPASSASLRHTLRDALTLRPVGTPILVTASGDTALAMQSRSTARLRSDREELAPLH
jgi:F420-0:gamma-glutamyl ligase